jgi:endonuclease/exonuclease/phosphatase family metal-dependent hydrolase
LRKFIKYVAFKINIVAAIFLVLSYLSAWVHPKYFWPISLNGVLYPFFLLLNVFFVVLWVVTKKRQLFLSLIIILIGIPFMTRYFQIHLPFKKHPDVSMQPQAIKFLSFNVRLFNLYRWVNKADAESDIVRFIQKESPDIICLQEFYTREKGKFSEKYFLQQFPFAKYKYIKYTYRNRGVSNFGIATFSKYPIVGAGELSFSKTYNQCIYVDIKHRDDTIRVYNTHLQSYRFMKQNFDFIDTLKLKYNPGQVNGMRDIIYRIKTAYIKRANQADKVADHISHSAHPVIVCGDFNDSPISYSYQKISKGLDDAFVEAGSGIGSTYFSKFPSFRIDYILHQRSFEAFNYRSPKLELSDHNPVICYILKK